MTPPLAASRPTLAARLLLASVGGIALFALMAVNVGWRLGAGVYVVLTLLLAPLVLVTAAVVTVEFFTAARARCSGRAAVAVITLLALAPVALAAWTYASTKHEFLLGFVPPAFNVDRVVYEKEERWGLPLLALPGDNETGLRVYELPEATATQIRRGGTSWLDRVGENTPSGLDRYAVYTDWHPTPVGAGARGRSTATYVGTGGDCGFCIEVDPAIWSEVTAMMDSPGGYYALGRSGLIIVSPTRRRAVFMFRG
jgi:hypothetical protein